MSQAVCPVAEREDEHSGGGGAAESGSDAPLTRASPKAVPQLAGAGPRESRFGGFLVWLYVNAKRRSIQRLALQLALRLEGGEFFSVSARRMFAESHDVHIGMYTHGGCFRPGAFDRRTTIGRYCSIAATAARFGRDHTMDLKSMHGFFFNERFGGDGRTIAKRGELKIGNDVWIGHNAVILPSVTSIGDGAVIGAGAVVNKNVPPYGVATGNPCRVVRYRFSKEMRAQLLEERWWDRPLADLMADLPSFQSPLEDHEIR